jgi:hypothetical protein
MTETIITQTEDLDITGTVLDINGNPVNLNLTTKMYVAVHDGYNSVFAKFSKTGLPAFGWSPIDLTNGATGVFKIKVLSSITNLLAEGKYYIELRLRYADVNYTDDSYNDVLESRIYVFTVKKSIINTLPSLP